MDDYGVLIMVAINVGRRPTSTFYAIDPDRDVLPRCRICDFGLDDLDAKWCVPCIDNAYQHADSYADRETVEWMQRVSVALARMQGGRR